MSRIGGHACRHVPDFKLHLQVVTGRIEPCVRHVGPALGRTRRTGQAHDFGAQKHTFDTCRHRVPAQQAGGGVAHPLDDIRQAEYRFLARKTVRQIFQHRRQSPDLLLGNLLRLTTALRVHTKGARSHDLSTSRSVHTHSRGPQSDRLLGIPNFGRLESYDAGVGRPGTLGSDFDH